jgi:hypothetical protein
MHISSGHSEAVADRRIRHEAVSDLLGGNQTPGAQATEEK